MAPARPCLKWAGGKRQLLPVIADVLGVKRGQLEGIRNPNGEIVELSQTDPNRIKRLAEDYLARHTGRRSHEEDAA
jgi:hypothetical protein